jgi:Na+/H+ antiporter NhaD/arsenite permease-like protein
VRWLLLALFALTYIAISARRLRWLPVGRPSVALIGACAMVSLGALAGPRGLTPEDALLAVDPGTMALLTGMMMLAAALELGGFFERATRWVLARAHRPVPLLYAVTLGAGVLSALLVNDAVCLLATPLVMLLCQRTGAPRVPFVLAVAMGSNAGSAMTLAGNPQNMLVARLSGLSYARYALLAAPAGMAALLVTAASLHWMFRRQLAAETTVESPPPAPPPSALLVVSLVALLGFTVAALLGAHLPFGAVTAASVALLAAGRRAHELLDRVDWTVLVFFAGLFILVAALRRTGLPDEALAALTRVLPPQGAQGKALLIGVLMVGSQIVSNVPLILLLEPWIRGFPDAGQAWVLTALVSTLAGNLTLLGSVANIIVIERAGAQDEVGFRSYTRVGLPVTLLSTAAALLLLWLLG